MSRRRAREAAMQALFQLDMTPPPEGGREEWKRALDAAWKDAPGNTEGEETYYPTRPKRSRKPANKKK